MSVQLLNSWNTTLENGGILVGDEVSITCEIQLIKSKKQAKAMKLEATETATETAEEKTEAFSSKVEQY